MMKMSTIAVLGLLSLSFGVQARAAENEKPTFAERLGWPKGARVVIFHIDDAGMSHDSNVGAYESMANGIGTSTSIMAPCHWVPEMVKISKDNPQFDVGLHVTLTAEWDRYRWGPVAGKQAVPGLTDKEGCLWDDVPGVVFGATPDEVETEIRAQLDRLEGMGIHPTHLDSHMGTVFFLTFFDRYLKVGIEKNIPVMFPAGHMTYIKVDHPEMPPEFVYEMGEKAWNAGLPVLDDLNTGGGRKDKKVQIIEFLREVKPGVTQFIVHSTRPSEVFGQISGSGGTRLAELEALTDPEVRKVVEDEGIILTTWRELKERRDKVK
jgi:predicted glycoside hydrolase/deacetylase ChbG (UPF0249 family)